MPFAGDMNGWASLYANLEKSAPALAAAPQRYVKRGTRLKTREVRQEPSALMVPESDSELSESDDEVELEEEEFYEVLQGSRTDHRSRKYASVTYLSPPKPNLHRKHNPEGMAERQRLRKYGSHPMHRAQSQTSDRYKVLPPLPRSASLPAANIIQETPTPSPEPDSPPTVSKLRKARPTPLDLVSRFRHPHTPVDPLPSSPYTPSILSLYSPQHPSPPSPSRTLSLPVYAFRPPESSLPERVRMSNPLPTLISSSQSTKSTTSSTSSSTSNSSPRTSAGSLCSSRTSLSSLRTDPEILFTMPTPPTPTASLSIKRDRIYNTLSPLELARRPSRELTYR